MVAETSKDFYPNPLEISAILTIRYNPFQKHILPKLDWKDFESINVEPSIELIEQSLKNSIRIFFEKENCDRISLALSGGIDSSLILALIKDVFPGLSIDAVSVKFSESVDETKIAQRIAEKFDVSYHVIYVENYLEELPKAISIVKQPFWDLHWYYVVKKTSSLSNVLASGDGGDELFGGYEFRYSKFITLVDPTSTPVEKVQAYLKCHERDNVSDQESLFGTKAAFSWNSIYAILMPFFDNHLPLLSQVFLADYNGKLLYNFSPTNNSLHKYFSIKSLSPFLSENMIRYTAKIHPSYKYDEKSRQGKLILKSLLKKLKIESLVTQEKQGFSVNTVNLWKNYGQKICEDFLLEGRIVKDKWIRKEWIDSYITKKDLDIRYVNKFLGLLAFEIWYRLFVTKELNSNTKL